MTKLQRRAMARLPMDAVAVEAMYTIAAAGSYVRDLCESHERLRAEMAGLQVLHDEALAEVERLLGQLPAKATASTGGPSPMVLDGED